MKIFINFLLFTLLLCATGSSRGQNTAGIGARLKLDTTDGHTMPLIQDLVPNSPASKSLKPNYFIISVDGKKCADKSLEDIVGWIRGTEGSKVKITIAANRNGKKAEDYELVRAPIVVEPTPNTPKLDPVAAFNQICENEKSNLKGQGHKIIRTFNSECGDFFFNFEAQARSYHIKVIAMEEKSSGLMAPDFSFTTLVSTDGDEAHAVALIGKAPLELGGLLMHVEEGTVSYQKDAVVTIGVKMNDNSKKCKALYIIVYK